MIKILFVCHGNICRSPMAEFLFRAMVTDLGLAADFQIASAATSTEEIGNPVHRGTRRKMQGAGHLHRRQDGGTDDPQDYDRYDYLIGMDQWNIRTSCGYSGAIQNRKYTNCWTSANIRGTSLTPGIRAIFETTYRDIREGCLGLLKHLNTISRKISGTDPLETKHD